MANLPPIELLEATHFFPCPYVIKVIGLSEEWFVERVIASVRDEMKLASDPAFRTRKTSGGKHVSITLELPMQTAQQVHSVYNRLLTLPGLIILL